MNVPKTTADYHAAAKQALETASAEAPQTTTPPAQEQATPPPAEQSTQTQPPAEQPPQVQVTEVDSPSMRKSFQRLAEQSKALREREERIRPLETLGRVVDPVKLERALVSRDPLAVLEATGLKYEDVVQRVLASQPNGNAAKEESAAPPHVKELEEKLARMERTLAEEKAASARTEILHKASNFLDAAKYPLSAKLGQAAVGQAIKILEDYHRENGKLPSESFEDNVHLALGLVEEFHMNTVRQYGLTPPSVTRSVTNQKEAPVQPRGEVSSQTTITSALTAPSQGGATPKTEADYRAAAVAAWKQQSQG